MKDKVTEVLEMETCMARAVEAETPLEMELAGFIHDVYLSLVDADITVDSVEEAILMNIEAYQQAVNDIYDEYSGGN